MDHHKKSTFSRAHVEREDVLNVTLFYLEDVSGSVEDGGT